MRKEKEKRKGRLQPVQMGYLGLMISKYLLSTCHCQIPPQVTVLGIPYHLQQASLVAQIVKNPPAMQKAWVRSLGREDPLEKGMATPSRILAWEIPRTDEPGGLQYMGCQRVRYDFSN